MTHYIFSILSFLVLSFSFSYGDQPAPLPKKRILVGSPIRQYPEILKEFLTSLEEVEKKSYTFDYCFVDDNNDPVSKQMLQDFAEKHKDQCVFLDPETLSKADYIVNEGGHAWSHELVWKVAGFKDRIIEHAKEKNYDYLFLIDSDLVLHPNTIEQLLADNKGIVCNIFWTSWQPGTIELPQVWLEDEYSFFHTLTKEAPSAESICHQTHSFLGLLRMPGVYEVGGMGACTLIDRASLLKGVSFKKIKNLSMWGEDRHFCVRAAVLEIPLFVDTHYPAYHIYRLSALGGVESFKEKAKETSSKTSSAPRLTLSMIIKNEANKYLRDVLVAANEYITDAVIIDDGSTDNSVEICKEVLGDKLIKLVINEQSKFANECSLREQQWNETVATNPDWILCLDADEIFEDKFKDRVGQMIADQNADAYLFRLYDFWDPTHYREDEYWQAHLYYRIFMVRYKPGMAYTFQQTAQHCGRFPLQVHNYAKSIPSDLRLKHYGWERAQSRIDKYERYNRLDPGARFGWKEQYESILDPNPHLVEWKE